MRTRRPWILVAFALLLGPLLAVAAQACGGQISIGCPREDGTGNWDPWCIECLDHMELRGCNRCLFDEYLGPSFACVYCPADYDPVVGPGRVCPEDAGTDSAITDGGTDAAIDSAIMDGATGCAGDCLPTLPFGWFGPDLVWFGPGGMEPNCPSTAPAVAYQGHADLVALPPATCTACGCSPMSGMCAPPAQITASTLSCAANGPPSQNFGPPPAWDGSCTVFDASPANWLCGGVPCAASLTAQSLVLTESGCTPSTTMLADVEPPTFATAVLGCHGEYPASACADLTKTCGPSAADASEFATCIFQKGDYDCPSTYPDKHLAYGGFDDQRSCAPCACSTPDSSCKAVLSVFEDGACAQKPALPPLDLTAAGPSCGDLPHAGAALGSKRLDALAYQPGVCAPSGGELLGTVEPAAASTFCCLA